MKKQKVFILLLIMCISIAGYAQIEKGKFLLGASSDLGLMFGSSEIEVTSQGNTVTSDGPTTMHFNISPMFGYFFTDCLAGGIHLNTSLASEKREVNTGGNATEELKSSSMSLLVGPFVRYYFNLEKIKPFIHADFGIGSQNYKDEYLDWSAGTTYTIKEDDDTYNIMSYGVGAGIAMFLNDNISIDAMIGYNSLTTKYEDDVNKFESVTKANNFGFNVGFSFLLP